MEHLYCLFLRLYPRAFREEYQEDLIQAFRDRRGEARHQGPLGRIRFGAFVAVDLVRSAAAVRLRSWLGGNRKTTTNDDGRMAMRPAHLAQDLRFAVRSYLRRPGFTLAAVATLALGVGAGTAVFSVVDGVLLRSLPYEDPEELVQIGTGYEGYDGLASTSPPDFFDWQEETRSFEAMAASRLERLTLLSQGEPTSLEGAGVSATYFRVLGVEPSRGRAFTAAEDAPGAEPVAVVSHGAWQRIWGGDPGVLGQGVRFDEKSFTVVGVMPESFHPPEAIYHQDVEIWYPLSHVSDPLDDRGYGFLQVIGRLNDQVSIETAREELQAVQARIAAVHEASARRSARVEPLYEQTVAGAEDAFNLIVGAVALLLLIACANVANLFLVRATERAREMAVRASLGAGRQRISGQLVVEALVLTLVAGAMGVALAHGGVEAFKTWGPGGVPRLAEVGVTGRVLAFALVLSTLTGVTFGLIPALHLRRGDPGQALRDRGTPGRGAGSRVRNGLVVAQTALAVVLVSGAGVLMNSFVRLTRVDPGFDPQGVAWMAIRLDGDQIQTAEGRVGFFQDVERRLSALPGVAAVGSTTNLPMTGNESRTTVTPEGMEPGPDERPPAWSYHVVTPGFFRALEIPLLRGRGFTAGDDGESAPVAVVNESLAARTWPGQDPLGKRFRLGSPEDEGPWITVVGVAGDVKQLDLASEEPAAFYIPYALQPRSRLVSVVRGRNPATLLRPMRRAVREVDPTLALDQAGTMEGQMARSVTEPRFYTLLLSAFGTVALILAFVGIYGTLAYSVEQRSHELGVRMAMGAGKAQVLGLVLRRGMVLTGVGVAGGVAAALASSTVLESFVFGITPTDPATLLAVVLGLVSVALLACWLPARRAASVDPVNTLRAE